MSISKSAKSVVFISDWVKTRFSPIASALPDVDLGEGTEDKLDALAEQERKAVANYSVCLLGQAGVGKSTLLNTLVAGAEIVVPSGGGTGPLTANALKVSYDETKSFRVLYHGKDKINQLRFTLDGIIYRESNDGTATDPVPVDEMVAHGYAKEAELDTEEDQISKSEAALRSAKLLITGEQTGDRSTEYLADGLRLIVGTELKYGSQILDEDLQRVKSVIDALLVARKGEYLEFSDAISQNFRKELRNHACGFLAPMINELEISWPSETLVDGIEIVDLPGIGIVSDVYANVTAHYLRKEAQSVMLVADSRGLREEDAILLRDSGFLVRLMHSMDDPESDPVKLIVVVVKIDDVATENHRNDKSENGKALSTKQQHFESVVQRCRVEVRRQLVDFIQKIWLSEDSDSNSSKQDVIRRLSDNLEVFPVSAIQYRMLIEGDEDENPFLKSEELTNIPALRKELIGAAYQQRETYRRRFQEGRKLFFDRISSQINTQIALRAENEMTPEMLALKNEFAYFTNKLNLEYNNRLGELRNYLRNTVPGKIADKVEISAGRAEHEINTYLGSMKNAHWATLRAAVRRKGSFQGARNINLPQDFALRFEEPLAEMWSKEILQGLREETKRFSAFRADAMAQIDRWAKDREINPPPLLEALLVDLNTEQQELENIESGAVEDLREHVRKSLQDKIEGPIREQCTEFVDSNRDTGAGVKSRILHLFETIAKIAVDAAKEPANELLMEQFQIAEFQLLKNFKENQNPIEQILSAFEDAENNSFAEQGGPTLEELKSLIDSMPVFSDEVCDEAGHL